MATPSAFKNSVAHSVLKSDQPWPFLAIVCRDGGDVSFYSKRDNEVWWPPEPLQSLVFNGGLDQE